MSNRGVAIIRPALDQDAYVKTQQASDDVCRMVATGLDESAIAFALQMDPMRMRRYFRHELEHGTSVYVWKVGSALIDGALRGDVNAQRLFLQARGRWTLPTKQEADRVVDKETQAERQRLMDAIVQKVRPAEESSKAKVGDKEQKR